MLRSHSKLSPSGASRWMECTPSAVFEADFPDTGNSDYADEGTLAHYIIELLAKNHFKKISSHVFYDGLKKAKKSKHYSSDLHNHCIDHLGIVLDYYNAMEGEKHISIEIELDLTSYIPEGMGHLDIVLSNEDTVHVIDFKYGQGIFVEAEKNKQLMIYALGALQLVELHTDTIENIVCTINQPRLKNHSSYKISKNELIKWGELVLKPKALSASKGEGEFKVGDHCRFCKAKNECKALYEYNVDLAKYEFNDVNKISDEDIAYVLSRKEIFKNWLNSIEEYALKEAVTNNRKWPGFKLVEGRSNRTFLDKEKVIQTLKDKKYHQNLFLSKPELLGITALEKNIGANKLNELIGTLIHKPPGAPTLVPNDDKRPELNKDEQAKKVFNNI